jgi:2-amino-4-hydroxy-6-hydroxymethyldihydropteridine diphosphokinase
MNSNTPTIALAFGSNVPPCKSHIDSAVTIVRDRVLVSGIFTCSRIYETEALLPRGAAENWNVNYLNCVIVGETILSPTELLAELKACEAKLGRDHSAQFWSPRPIDIDIIVYNDARIQEPGLTLPHLQASYRSWVLMPLCEVLPDCIVKYQEGSTISAQQALEWLADDPSIIDVLA